MVFRFETALWFDARREKVFQLRGEEEKKKKRVNWGMKGGGKHLVVGEGGEAEPQNRERREGGAGGAVKGWRAERLRGGG